MAMLIIGCGNAQRGDDAAGIMAANRLRLLGVSAQICCGEPSQLIEMWKEADDVIVIDAVITGAPPGSLHVWDGRRPWKLGKPLGSTHGLGLAEAIELSRTLGSLPRNFRVFGIEAGSFVLGSEVSLPVAKAIEQVTQEISREWNRQS
jgi:hydrogenase maturation protease